MDCGDWTGKKVFLKTRQGHVYSGIVVLIEQEEHLVFITIKDKFGKLVCSFVLS